MFGFLNVPASKNICREYTNQENPDIWIVCTRCISPNFPFQKKAKDPAEQTKIKKSVSEINRYVWFSMEQKVDASSVSNDLSSSNFIHNVHKFYSYWICCMANFDWVFLWLIWTMECDANLNI